MYRDPAKQPGICPTCHCILRRFSVGEHTYERCEPCGGAFVDSATLERMWREIARADEEMLLEPRGLRDRPCPACRRPMDPVELWVIPLDRCREHGVWFDRHELEAVLASSAIEPSSWLRLFAEHLHGMS
jgi:Zn-finger nucleic acid-binding protein